MAKDLKTLLDRAKKAMSFATSNSSPEAAPAYIPSEGDDEGVRNFIQALKEDSLSWRKSSLGRRFRGYDDPVRFWKDARKLEAGNHWEVWGGRKSTKHKWKAELVEDEIGNQIRAKKAYITGNTHDLQISPNINHIDKIIDQEREDTNWSEVIREGLHKAKVEGTAIFHSIIDTENRPEGQAREIVLDNESVLPTPYARSFALRDGNWYVGIVTAETLQQILAEWEDEVDPSELTPIQDSDTADASGGATAEKATATLNLKKTDFYESLVFYLDDPAVEVAPFEQQEADFEHGRIHQGLPVTVTDRQNHEKHINAHIDWLDEIWSNVEDLSEEEISQLQALTELTVMHIEEHQTAVELSGLKSNQRRRYPFGRKIIIKGGVVVLDAPNPLEVPWRKLFTIFHNEKVPTHFWGRGDVEILWNRNYIMDDMLSKYADAAWLNSVPKEYWHIDDKETLEDEDYSDDPTLPQFYLVAPPERRTPGTVPAFMEVFGVMRDSANRASGISEVTYGRSPHARASGQLAEMLIQQSAVLVTGEANVNLNEVVTKLIETRLLLMREFYTQPRYYELFGRRTMMVVSDLLSSQPVFDQEGNHIGDEEVPQWKIQVKPRSNFPTKSEEALNIALQLSQMVHPTAQVALAPPEAVWDALAEIYPEFGEGGRYHQISQVLQLGMQALQEQQQAEEENEAVASQIQNRLNQAGIEQLMGREQS